MKAIITVIGRDAVGIIAGICTCLAGRGVNVLDINQTTLQDLFVMNMLVELGENDFAALTDALNAEGERLGVNVRMQREDIFDAMHRI